MSRTDARAGTEQRRWTLAWQNLPRASTRSIDRVSGRLGQALLSLPRDLAVYRARGIDLKDISDLRGQHILRVLLPEHREELLATEEELRRFIPADLPLLLRLEAWHHPDLSHDELPSGNATFKELAAARVR